MPTSSDDKVAFVMRANPDQVAHLERLMRHTGQRQRTKAVWMAVERYPEMSGAFDEARREIDHLRDLLDHAADVLAEAETAMQARDAVLAEIRSEARPHQERRSVRETLRPRVHTADLPCRAARTGL